MEVEICVYPVRHVVCEECGEEWTFTSGASHFDDQTFEQTRRALDDHANDCFQGEAEREEVVGHMEIWCVSDYHNLLHMFAPPDPWTVRKWGPKDRSFWEPPWLYPPVENSDD